MGFWSAVCSVASGIGSAIKSVGGALTSRAGKALGVVGGLAAKAAGFVGMAMGIIAGPLGPVVGPMIASLLIKVVVKEIEYLAKKVGIIGEKEKTKEVGYRIEEAEEHREDNWKRWEDFQSFEEYYAYLKEQIPEEAINQEKLKTRADEYAVLGMHALAAGIEEKNGIELPESFLFEIGRCHMEHDEIQAIIDAFKKLGYSSVELTAYLRGKLPLEKSRQLQEALLASMHQYYPEKDQDTVLARLDAMRVASQVDTQMKDLYAQEFEAEYHKTLDETEQAAKLEKMQFI